MKPPVDYYTLNEVSPAQLKAVIVVARFENEWLFTSANLRLWGLPESEIFPGEDADSAARRCLSSCTGTEDFTLAPVCIYHDACYGEIFFGDLHHRPSAAGLGFFSSVPPALSDPRCCPFHFEWVQWWLSMQSSADELWDVYDEQRTLTGRTHRRGDPLPAGDYHLVVHVWVQNPDGSIFLTQRAPNKGHPLLWECSGGSALAGETSLTAALREAAEESGIVLDPQAGVLLFTDQREGFICDIWLFRQDVSSVPICLLPGETVDYRFVTKEGLQELNQSAKLVPFVYFDELLKFL